LEAASVKAVLSGALGAASGVLAGVPALEALAGLVWSVLCLHLLTSVHLHDTVNTECGAGCWLSVSSEHDGGDTAATNHGHHMATLRTVGCGSAGAEVHGVDCDRLSAVNGWLDGLDGVNDGLSLGRCEAAHESLGGVLCVSHGYR